MAKRKPAPEPTVALVYLRVSTVRQVTEGVGLDTQEAKCKAHAERMGWPVAEVFRDEGISGKDGLDDRPGLAKLLKVAATMPNAVVVVYSVSRLARRQRLLWQLLDDDQGFGMRISSATENFDTTTPMGRAMLGMIGVWCQLEADMVGERTRHALAIVKAQGTKLGNKFVAEKNPEVATLIKNLRATGLTIRQIVDELNARGIPTVGGGKEWRVNTVHSAIKSLSS